jgi:hypothetical protein
VVFDGVRLLGDQNKSISFRGDERHEFADQLENSEEQAHSSSRRADGWRDAYEVLLQGDGLRGATTKAKYAHSLANDGFCFLPYRIAQIVLQGPNSLEARGTFAATARTLSDKGAWQGKAIDELLRGVDPIIPVAERFEDDQPPSDRILVRLSKGFYEGLVREGSKSMTGSVGDLYGRLMTFLTSHSEAQGKTIGDIQMNPWAELYNAYRNLERDIPNEVYSKIIEGTVRSGMPLWTVEDIHSQRVGQESSLQSHSSHGPFLLMTDLLTGKNEEWVAEMGRENVAIFRYMAALYAFLVPRYNNGYFIQDRPSMQQLHSYASDHPIDLFRKLVTTNTNYAQPRP